MDELKKADRVQILASQEPSGVAAIQIDGHDYERKQRQDDEIVKPSGEAREQEHQCQATFGVAGTPRQSIV